MEQLFPERRAFADPLAIYDDIAAPPVYANMVSSVDGRAVLEGRAAGLGSRVDKSLMARLRAHADCILNGAGTARAESIHRDLRPELVERRRARGQSEQPIWAIATGSGDVDVPAAGRFVVFVAERTPTEARARLEARAEVVVAGADLPEPTEMVRLLRERYGCERVLCEGGPALLHAFFAAGALDELFFTFAPKVVGGDGKTIVDGPRLAAGLELVTLFEHESELFFRYRVMR